MNKKVVQDVIFGNGEMEDERKKKKAQGSGFKINSIEVDLYLAWILGGEAVSVAVVDGVVIRAAILLAVGGVLLIPWGGVERAGGSVRNAVLGQKIGVEEVLKKKYQSGPKDHRIGKDCAYASIIFAASIRMAVVVGSGGVAGSRAFPGIERALEVFLAQISIHAI